MIVIQIRLHFLIFTILSIAIKKSVFAILLKIEIIHKH